MAYIYVKRDGERVETHVAAAFDRLEKAFTRAFPGLGLIVASGTRTRAEQAELYRLWQAGRGNLAAAPGYSNHEESGPAGPRALDVWDTGRDAGVTVAGTKRANWLRANAPKFGFNPAGYGFARVEPWHIEYTGPLSGGGVKHVTVSRPVKDIQKLVGAKPDGIWGPETEGKVKTWQKKNGLTADGIWGPLSDAKGFPKSKPAKPAKPKPAKTSTYTVRAGDTLTAIATRHGTTVSALVKANGIKDPNLIRVGQTLKITGKTKPAAATTYTVKAGDNLTSIAKRHGTTVAALVKANGIRDADLIYPGQKLKINGGK